MHAKSCVIKQMLKNAFKAKSFLNTFKYYILNIDIYAQIVAFFNSNQITFLNIKNNQIRGGNLNTYLAPFALARKTQRVVD